MTVYQHGFEPGTAAERATGVTANLSHTKKSVPPSGRGFLGDFGNQTVTLTLGNLPAHAALTVSADLYLLRSWDGDSPTWGPDRWSFRAAGRTLVNHTFRNWAGPSQTYGGPGAPAGTYPARTGAAEVNTLGSVDESGRCSA